MISSILLKGSVNDAKNNGVTIPEYRDIHQNTSKNPFLKGNFLLILSPKNLNRYFTRRKRTKNQTKTPQETNNFSRVSSFQERNNENSMIIIHNKIWF